MSDTFGGLFGFALIIGLFVWYARERRAKRRAAMPSVQPVEAVPAVEVDRAAEPGAEVVVRGPSTNWGAPIVYVLLLHAALWTEGTWWSMLWLTIYFAIFGVAWYSMFSEKEFADEQARRPGTTRRDHYLKIGVPYLLFPMLGWLGVFVFGWKLAVFVPAVPWLVLLAAGAVMIFRQS